jgi:hypothetical protein
MRPAARGQIEVRDIDEPNGALALRLLAQPERRSLGGIDESDPDLAIFPDDSIRLVLGARDLRSCQLAAEIDRRGLDAEMKALRPRAEHAIEGRRQHVLPGVLLPVVEGARSTMCRTRSSSPSTTSRTRTS